MCLLSATTGAPTPKAPPPAAIRKAIYSKPPAKASRKPCNDAASAPNPCCQISPSTMRFASTS